MRAICEAYLDETGLDEVELALVEAVTNIIQHGYKGDTGNEEDSIKVAVLVGG